MSAFIAFVSLSLVAGYAQQTAPTETPVKLEKFVVTGSHIPMSLVSGEATTFPTHHAVHRSRHTA